MDPFHAPLAMKLVMILIQNLAILVTQWIWPVGQLGILIAVNEGNLHRLIFRDIDRASFFPHLGIPFAKAL